MEDENLEMPGPDTRITARNVRIMPPEHPQTAVQRRVDFVDVQPLERIRGFFCIYYLVTRLLLER